VTRKRGDALVAIERQRGSFGVSLGGILAIGGFAAALWYFFGYLGSVGWGPPGTEAYVVYERANRLASVPLLVHLAGWTVLVRDRAWRRVAAIGALGSLMMLAGNVGEFWIFSGESYTSVARNVSWMTFLLGTLAAVVGLVALVVRRLVVRAAASGISEILEWAKWTLEPSGGKGWSIPPSLTLLYV
jgi:hypothetical protein